jgi:hypothetical protein
MSRKKISVTDSTLFINKAILRSANNDVCHISEGVFISLDGQIKIGVGPI